MDVWNIRRALGRTSLRWGEKYYRKGKRPRSAEVAEPRTTKQQKVAPASGKHGGSETEQTTLSRLEKRI
jgi:hypothetical protein